MPEQPGEVGRHSGVDMSEADFLSECTEFLTLAALEMTARGLTRAKFVRAAGQFGSETQDWKQRLFGSDGALAQHPGPGADAIYFLFGSPPRDILFIWPAEARGDAIYFLFGFPNKKYIASK